MIATSFAACEMMVSIVPVAAVIVALVVVVAAVVVEVAAEMVSDIVCTALE